MRNGDVKDLNAKDINFGYRSSSFPEDSIILDALLKPPKAEKSYILKKIKRLLLIRLLLMLFPSFLSNFIYDLIAKSRYLLFGKYSSCPVLVGNLKSRIIE